MDVFHGLDRVAPKSGDTVLTIGNFDGVHVGHRRLIETGRSLVSRHGGCVIVLTFEPHPLSIVAPSRAPRRLSTVAQKLEWLADAGADAVVVAASEPALLGLEPEDFVREVIQARFAPRHIVEGPSFGFGKGRRGDNKLLETLTGQYGFALRVVEPVTVTCQRGDKLLVSSSLIRTLVTDGDVERAALCLGRYYELSGTVVRVDGRGRTIGFPTANVEIVDQVVPGEGVYAGRCAINDKMHLAAISIGTVPTFEGRGVRIEAHLLDFNRDIYGQRVSLAFERRLRDQRKFSSADALIQQIEQDVDEVRSLLSDNTSQWTGKDVRVSSSSMKGPA